MLNLPITEGELTFLAKFVNCAPILLCGRIAHTAWFVALPLWASEFVDLHRSDPDFRNVPNFGFCMSAWQIWRKNSAGLY